jgi:hypothetical protein
MAHSRGHPAQLPCLRQPLPCLRQPRSHVLALIGYTMLTLLMTYPLAARISTQLAGSGDDMWLFQWNNWWLRKALQEGLDPYFTTFLFHPAGVSLVYHNFSWLNTTVWLVLEPLIGTVAAYNVTFLLSFIISGYATFVLVSYLTHSRAAAFVAGLAFAFSPYHLSQFNHPNLISVQWLPFCILFLIRTVREGRWRHVLLCILSLILTGLSRWQLLIFAAVLVTLYLGYSLLFERARWSRRTVLALAAIGLGTAVCIGPLAYPLIAGLADQETASNILTEQQEWAQTDLLAYVIPNRFHPLFGQYMMPVYDRFRKNRGHIAFLGYAVLLLGGYGIVRARRAALYWALTAACLLLLALGPVLRFNGHLYPGIPMPHRLVGWLPPIKALRNSDRFNIVLSLPLAVLVGYGATHLQHSLKHRLPPRWHGRAIALSTALLASLVLFEFLSVPFPTVAPLSSPFYHELAQEPGDFAILEVPMGRGYSKATMFLQTLHGKRLVEGHISRTPPDAYDTIRDNLLLNSLSEEGDLDTSRCDLSRQLGSLDALGIRYIVIHKQDVPPERLIAWRDYLTISPRYEDDDLLVYRTRPRLGQDFCVHAALGGGRTLGGGLALVRASVAPTRTNQGGVVSLDLRWTAPVAPAKDYAARLALVNPAGEAVQESTERVCGEWPTARWEQHALVVDRRQIQVNPFLPPSAYQVALSVVDRETGQVLDPSQVIGTLEVAALERQFTTPPMQHTTAATFGGALDLLGYDLHQEKDVLHVILHWQARRRLDYYKVFVHLYDVQRGDLMAQNDFVPRQWTYPTNWWEAGEVVSDGVMFDITELPPGRYRLVVGVYEPDTGVRLALPSGQNQLNLEGETQIP